jgi:GR25 family glycosyltransferase involved in LPS biosynthesis
MFGAREDKKPHVMLNFFDCVYIINLPSRTDRRMEMEQEFLKIRLPIDGEKIRFFPAVRPDGAAGFPTLGTRGCFLSHVAALTHARDSGKGSVLILEDDCNFVGDFCNGLKSLMESRSSADWGFVYGGTLNAIDPDKLNHGRLDAAHGVLGAHFLGVNGSVLSELVSYLEAILTRQPGDALGGPMHVDGAYSWFRNAHPQYATFIAVPEIAYQRSSATDIHQRKWFEAYKAAQWVLRHLRRLKNAMVSMVR